MFIYVIKCTKNKYYIGKTKNIDFRLTEHFDQNASIWTKRYKPLELIEVIPQQDNFDEDIITKIKKSLIIKKMKLNIIIYLFIYNNDKYNDLY